jgi:hypothetical protein
MSYSVLNENPACGQGMSPYTVEWVDFSDRDSTPAKPEPKKAQHTDDAEKTDSHGSEKQDFFTLFNP